MNVNLNNPSFNGDSPRGGDTETVAATFTLVSGPTAVPEPGTMALLGAGLIGLGIARRRAKADTSAGLDRKGAPVCAAFR